ERALRTSGPDSNERRDRRCSFGAGQFKFDIPAQGKHPRAGYPGLRARRRAAGWADRQAGEGLAQQDFRDQPQIEGRANRVADQDSTLAADLHCAVLWPRRCAAGVVGGEGRGEEGCLRGHAARLSAPLSRSSAASSVASRFAKQKRTTERIGSLAKNADTGIAATLCSSTR